MDARNDRGPDTARIALLGFGVGPSPVPERFVRHSDPKLAAIASVRFRQNFANWARTYVGYASIDFLESTAVKIELRPNKVIEKAAKKISSEESAEDAFLFARCCCYFFVSYEQSGVSEIAD
jgi:hypothetical protein